MKEQIKSKCIGYSKTLIFPIILYAFFAVIALISQNFKFFNSYTTTSIFQESVLSTIVALAIAIPLSGGRWDFATGTIAVLGGIIGLNIAMMIHAPVIVALLLCIVSCVVLAVIEGLLYLLLRVPTMITSLGVVMIYEALTNILFEGKGVNVFNNTLEYTNELTLLYQQPYCYIILIVVMLLVGFLLYRTRFGADTRSLGANSKLAINAGVKEKKNIILTYVLIGCLLGVAAILNASKAKIESQANLSSTNLMFASMGPVLVGLFLAKYSNLPWGAFIGAVGFNVITYGLASFGIDASIQNIITGVVIVLIMAYTTNKDIIANFIEKNFIRRKDVEVDESK